MTTETTKLPLGGYAWLKAIADEKEEMLHALGAVDEDARKEEQREIQGLRDAAFRILKLETELEALILSCRAPAGHFISVKAPTKKALERALSTFA
jgi:hypothetical protein